MLRLIFLKYADRRFTTAEKNLDTGPGGGRSARPDYQAQGVMYLPRGARFSKLLELWKELILARAINDAMEAIEKENDDLAGVLPRPTKRSLNRYAHDPVAQREPILGDIDGDGFGKVTSTSFESSRRLKARRASSFFTPTSIVKPHR